MGNASPYLNRLIGFSAGLVLAAGLINYFVDPYRIYHLRSAASFHRIKPEADKHDVLTKSHALEQIRPAAILLGNSRVEVGFDPASRGFGIDVQPVVNAGLEGTGTASQLRFLRFAYQVGSPKLVILGTDFLNFLLPSDAQALQLSAAQEQRDRMRPVLDSTQRREDFVHTLISADAFIDSLK